MKNELTFENHENGFKVAEILLKEDYVVMLSYEENLLILNYEWSEHGADRNDVVFMPAYEFDELKDEVCEGVFDDVMNDITRDYVNGTLGGVLAPRIEKWKDDISSI